MRDGSGDIYEFINGDCALRFARGVSARVFVVANLVQGAERLGRSDGKTIQIPKEAMKTKQLHVW